MKRIFATAVMAVAVLTTLGLAGPGVVSAGASSQAATAHISNLYGKGGAGYRMTGGGWRFRYLATTLTVPPTETRATSARLSLWDYNDALDLWIGAGGGPGSIRYAFSYDDQATPLAVAPSVGDQVTVSIYYDRKALKAYLTAVDHTQGTSATDVRDARRNFIFAEVSAGGPTWSLARSNTRLWAFKDTRLTSFNGTHGTILGPWPTYRIIGTRGGAPTGTVVLWPGYPWNNGHNFSIWWRAAS
jgi:hypothetical protein